MRTDSRRVLRTNKPGEGKEKEEEEEEGGGRSLSDALKGSPVPRSGPDHYASELGCNGDPVPRRPLSKERDQRVIEQLQLVTGQIDPRDIMD